jgi:DNA modification methylase
MINQIINNDCFNILKDIPDNSIDMILTDPPYMVSKEAKIARQRNPLKRAKFYGKDISMMFGDWDMFASEEEYWKFIYKFLDESKRVLRNGGQFLCFFDKFKITPLVEWSRKNGFIPRQPLYYIKKNPCPMARKVSFMNSHEQIFWATKFSTSRKYAVFNYELGQHKDFEEAPITPTLRIRERHPTEKPLKIISWLISYLSKEEEIILDPFCGTGVTAEACIRLNRKFICIEKDKKWSDIALSRIKPLLEQTKLSENGNKQNLSGKLPGNIKDIS